MESTELNDTPFHLRLEALESQIKSLMETHEYQEMLATGYIARCEVSLGDVLLGIQECFNDYTLTKIYG